MDGFAGWDRLVKVLSRPESGGAGCRALKQDRDDQGHALVLSAVCFFSDGMTTVSAPSRAAVDAIAAELRGATDREFWIAANAPVGPGAVSTQTMRERAAAFVNALIAAGVPPNRLAALMGSGGEAELASSRLAETPLAGAATIEIVAAPVSMSGP